MRLRSLISAMLGATAFLVAANSHAATVGFVDNPATNSSDWAAAVGLRGGTVNSNVDFNALSTGALDGSFYTASDGVTIVPNGAVGSVIFGAGPGQSNSGGALPGEGVHSASNFLQLGSGPASLIFNFADPVFAAGLFTVDAFTNAGLEIEAFTGLDGTGTSLGLFSSVADNFQTNNLYFLGLVADIGFRSFVFRDVVNNGGDVIGVDDFVFATEGGVAAVPLPAAGWMLLTAIGGLGLSAWRRRRG